ncbi:hypothetical protein M3Y95_00390400 [Aphelenchoides besseyi]|nr:hypothetical protein M3Y95_00390400 [Aphelenchoides besseyi]
MDVHQDVSFSSFGSHRSFRVLFEDEQQDLFADSSSQIDMSNEVVQPKNLELNEIEKLEVQLVEVTPKYAHHAAELKRLKAQDVLQEQLVNSSLNGIEAIKLIVILVTFFLFLRFIFMADVFVVLALFESITLILLFIGYKRKEHVFFWPFALSCFFELFVAVFQLLFTVVSLFAINRISNSDFELMTSSVERLFTHVLVKQMTDWLTILKILFYLVCKIFAFVFVKITIIELAWKLRTKKIEVAEKQEVFDEIDRQANAVKNQLNLLLIKRSNFPVHQYDG